ncbi:IS200/IS605 family transposase [Membranihabitans marinus]|uniref:IS200/IS605 family transposase n=1 Tax=Membranihabitans marinus TaxID=1227546 RepID=UPI001F0124FC|nr:IS200/IS605 family transposase [Membranihabitans marinus]
MGQSLVKNYVHIIFSTEHRQPFIKPPFDNELHRYLGGLCNKFECPVLIVGGHIDHIHILCMLSKKVALMSFIQKIKSNSSKWIKSKYKSLDNFYWQDGYGAFSVSPDEIKDTIDYIKNQKQHHSKMNFKQEYITFLKKYKLIYKEPYVWE